MLEWHTMTVMTSPRLAEIIVEWFAGREWTEAEYLQFASARNAIVELVDGKVVLEEMPSPRHQTVVLNLALALRQSDLGKVFVAPMPVRLDQGQMREPDVVFFLRDHLDRVHDQYADPPDLAAEVLSPSTRSVDLEANHTAYARAGIAEYWIVDVEARTVDVHLLDPESRRFGTPRRHGLAEAIRPATASDVTIPVGAIFAD